MSRRTTLRKFLTCVALGTTCFLIFTAESCAGGGASTQPSATATPCKPTTTTSCPPTATPRPPTATPQPATICLTSPETPGLEVFTTTLCEKTGHVYGNHIKWDASGAIQSITASDCPSVGSSEGDCTPIDSISHSTTTWLFKDNKTGYNVILSTSQTFAPDGSQETDVTLAESPPGGATTIPAP